MNAERFTLIGDNLHTGHSLPRGAAQLQRLKDGREAIAFPAEGGKILGLPIPDAIKSSTTYRQGRVPHVLVAVELGLKGTPAQQRAASQYVSWLASAQVGHGAQFIAICVDDFGQRSEERIAAMQWLVPLVQSGCDRPLAVHAEDPRVLLAGLQAYDTMKGGRPMMIAASLAQPPTFQLAAEFRAHVVILTCGTDKFARLRSADDRVRHAEEAMLLATKAGIPTSDTYLDPMMTPAAKDPRLTGEILNTIRSMRRLWPDAHVAGHHAAISDRLPMADVVTLVWLRMTIGAGADAGLLDPMVCRPERFADVDWEHPAFRMAEAGLTGEDRFFAEFVAAAQTGEIADPLAGA